MARFEEDKLRAEVERLRASREETRIERDEFGRDVERLTKERAALTAKLASLEPLIRSAVLRRPTGASARPCRARDGVRQGAALPGGDVMTTEARPFVYALFPSLTRFLLAERKNPRRPRSARRTGRPNGRPMGQGNRARAADVGVATRLDARRSRVRARRSRGSAYAARRRLVGEARLGCDVRHPPLPRREGSRRGGARRSSVWLDGAREVAQSAARRVFAGGRIGRRLQKRELPGERRLCGRNRLIAQVRLQSLIRQATPPSKPRLPDRDRFASLLCYNSPMIERECPVCKAVYLADPKRLKWGRATTCSRVCSYVLRCKERVYVGRPRAKRETFTCPTRPTTFERCPVVSIGLNTGRVLLARLPLRS